MQRLVKGATKPKVAAPKAKYIEPLLESTFSRGQDFEQAMDALSRCLSRSPTWSTSYKALIVVHIMIREGQQDAVLRFLSRHPRMLELDDDVARQAAGLGRYARYLGTRAAQFKDTKIDYVRYKSKNKSRLFGLSVEKGLLRECESVIVQIDALIKCHFDERDVDNDVTLMAFRLLVHDLLSLFQVLNEGVINLLEHFFELSRYDAEHALEVYKGFTRLTSKVIAFLKVAKNLEYQTKLHVPNIKHAPTSLVSSLEVYLNDPDFDINRRQYLAEKQVHKSSKADLRTNDRDLARRPTLIQQAREAEDRDVPLSQVQRQQSQMGQRQVSQQSQQSQASYQSYQQPQQQQPPQQPLQASMYAQPQQQGQPQQSLYGQSQSQSQPQSQPLQSASTGAQPQVDLLTGDVSTPLYQVQAARIQLQQEQAQMQLQQMRQQQQIQQQSISDLQRQQSMGFNFSQPAPPPQQQQPAPTQPLYSQPQNGLTSHNTGGGFQPQIPGQLTGQHTGQYQAQQAPVQQAPVQQQHTGNMGFNFGQGAVNPAVNPVVNPTPTGSNPFKRNSVPVQQAQPTGHNPFHRQSALPQTHNALQGQATGGYTPSQPLNMGGINPVNTGGFNSYMPQQSMVPQGTGRNPFRTSIQ